MNDITLKRLDEAVEILKQFQTGTKLKKRVAKLESLFCGGSVRDCRKLLTDQNLNNTVLDAALLVKEAASQIDVVIHTIGILISLPYVLEDGECVEYLSLGAGNTGKDFDLETDRRVAEFKFIHWREKSNTVRQNQVFKDFVNLVAYVGNKERYLYLLDKQYALTFLQGNRALTSVLSRKNLSDKFRKMHGDKYRTVGDYYSEFQHLVAIVDIRDLVPEFSNDSVL